MAHIPKNLLKNNWLDEYLIGHGFELVGRGKVRDTWKREEGRLLVIATDRISIFDFVLNALIPKKGEVLTAMTHFWLTEVLADFPNHLIQDRVFPNFNAALELADEMPELPVARCLVVEDLSGKLDSSELIFRAHLGGSVWSDYEETGIVAGQKMPEGLIKWGKLPEPIFTPSTKETEGHDINKSADYYYSQYGFNGRHFVNQLLDFYKRAYDYAEKKGILILDTKFEGSSSLGILADEVLTPDSSRFCEGSNWQQAMEDKKEPSFLDKQVIREWGAKIETPFGITGLKNLKDTTNPEYLKFVHGLKVPPEIIKSVSDRYFEIFLRLTGMTLSNYQSKNMGILN